MTAKKKTNGTAAKSSVEAFESHPLHRDAMTIFGSLFYEARIPVAGVERLKKFDDLTHPKLWTKMAPQLAKGDIVLCRASDLSWLALLECVEKTDHCLVMRQHWKSESKQPPWHDLGPLTIREIAGRSKIYAVDAGGGDILVADFKDHDAALDWAKTNNVLLADAEPVEA